MCCRSSGDAVGDRSAGEEEDHGVVFPCLFTLHRATVCLRGQVDNTFYFYLFISLHPTHLVLMFGLAGIIIMAN